MDLESIEALIRAGRIDRARSELQALRERDAPPARRSRLAGLFRRVGLPRVSVRLLYPVVRPRPRSRWFGRPPQANEACEYAAALSRLGAASEAIGILAPWAAEGHPQAIHFLTLARFKRGEPELALPWLRKLISLPDASEYYRALAQVNLLDALVTLGRWHEAAAVARTYRRALGGHPLLHGIFADLRAQLAIWRERPEAAGRALAEAERQLADSRESTYGISVRRTRAILAFRTGLGAKHADFPGRAARTGLRALRRELAERGLWEPLRDLDLHVACATGDAGLFAHLYFGSGSDSTRERVAQEAARAGVTIPERAQWIPDARFRPRTSPARTGRVSARPGAYDVATGTGLAGGRLKPGQLLFRLMRSLCSDSYRDFSLFELHGDLFAGMPYRGESSSDQVRQVIRRLRAQLRRDGNWFAIVERQGFYRLVSSNGQGRVLKNRVVPGPGADRARPGSERVTGYLDALPDELRARAFAVSEAAVALGFSRRQALVLLSEALREGKLSRSGQGRGTRYRFLS